MLTPNRMLRLLVELIFLLLGGLVIWLGWSGRISVLRHGVPWLILSIALVLWGLRALIQRGTWWMRWENWTRGLSLTLLGVLMLAMTRVSFLWLGKLIALGGMILLLRGIVGCVLVFRPR